MNNKRTYAALLVSALLATLATAVAVSGQDRNTVTVPGGLSFANFKGYEKWEVVSVSHNGEMLAVILGDPAMIAAFKSGSPGNGKPFPDGARMAKIHWKATKKDALPGQPQVAGALHDVDFMLKNAKRFADSGGWGYAQFEYEASSESFRAGTLEDKPPQGHDAKCGYACHIIATKQDFVFTEYPKR